MARHLRYIPPGSLVETTCRTIQGRHLLRPGSRFNRIFIGILARAQSRYRMRVCEPVCLSNHYHLLLIPENALQLALFMNYLNSNLAREAGRLYDWNARFWQTRFSSVPVSDEEAAQVERLLYVLAQGCKEGLVASPLDWPGVNGTRAWLQGTPLQGVWIDRTAAYRARNRAGESRISAFEVAETLELSPLPCWAHLDPQDYRDRYAELVRRVELDAARLAKDTGREPAGAEAVMGRDPHFWPSRVKQSPAPRIHAATKAARIRFRKAYSLFLAAYRLAAERLRVGVLDVAFPEGSFPPPRRFVTAQAT